MNKTNLITGISVFFCILIIVGYFTINEDKRYETIKKPITTETCDSILEKLETEENSFKEYTHSDLPRKWILGECWK